jgi:hypothetical protein
MRACRVPGSAAWPWLIPGILLLMYFSRYDHRLTPMVALALAALLAAAYVCLPVRGPWPRAAAALALGAVSYYVSAGNFVLFVAVGGLYELLIARRYVCAASCLVVAGVAPYAAVKLGLGVFTLGAAYLRMLPFQSRYTDLGTVVNALVRGLPFPGRDFDRFAEITALAVLGFFPLGVIAAGARPRLARAWQWARRPWGRGATGVAPPVTPAPSVARRYLVEMAKTVMIVAVIVAAAHESFDARENALRRVDYFANVGMWQEALDAAGQAPADDFFVRYDVTRALYHTRRLLPDMFRYPQQNDYPLGVWLPTDGPAERGRALVKTGDLYYELGLLNSAEHMADDAAACGGRRPWLLQRLALVYLGKGRVPAARIYLGAASADMVYGPWARARIETLAGDPTLGTDAEVQRLRSVAIETDLYPAHVITHADTEPVLLALLEKNPGNRMAFEYLMVHYMLTRQIKQVAMNLHRLPEFGYADAPRPCAEAAAMFLTKANVSLPGVAISAETTRRMRRFQELIATCGPDGRLKAKAALTAEFGDTYWFYFFFGCSASGRDLGAVGLPAKETP